MIAQVKDEHARLAQRLRQSAEVEADHVGQVAQARHQELAAGDHEGAELMWELARVAARAAPPRMRRLRIVTITSNSAGSFAALLRSLRAALDDAGWREGKGPDVEVLRIANDAAPEIDAEHRKASAPGITIRVVEPTAVCRPLPLAAARPFAFRCVRELGWEPSANAPVWSIDEDFRFETLVPSPRAMFVRRSGGPLLHRLDALVARLAADGADVLVGGNTGAAPVPTLGLLSRQLQDLEASVTPGPPHESLESLARRVDAYYDLAANPAPSLRVPLMRAWWRDDGQVDMSDVVCRLTSGLPVTRPALAIPLQSPPDPWATYAHAGIAGGNTLLLSPRALEGRFMHVRHGALISRRADTTWVIDARRHGARIVRGCLPLFHDRQHRPQTPQEAAREALCDALGVGVYRSMLAGEVAEATILTRAEARLAALRSHLMIAEATARRMGIPHGRHDPLADWIAEARASLALTRSAPMVLLGDGLEGAFIDRSV